MTYWARVGEMGVREHLRFLIAKVVTKFKLSQKQATAGETKPIFGTPLGALLISERPNPEFHSVSFVLVPFELNKTCNMAAMGS